MRNDDFFRAGVVLSVSKLTHYRLGSVYDQSPDPAFSAVLEVARVVGVIAPDLELIFPGGGNQVRGYEDDEDDKKIVGVVEAALDHI